MGKLIRILIVLGVIVTGLFFAKNLIAKVIVENGVKMATGLPLKMKELDVAFLNTSIRIKELKLYNPAGYEERIMVDMPEIYVDYALGDILGGNIHLPELLIHLEEFTVVKNAQGEVNLNALKALQKPAEKAPAEEKPAPKKEAPSIQIDKLSLRIGKVVYKDYSGGGEPSVKEFKIGINEQYSDITNPNQLVRLIVLKVMMNTPLATLTGINISDLSAGVTDVLASSTQIATDTFMKTAAELKDQTQLLKDQAADVTKHAESAKTLVKDASGELKQVTGSLGETAGDLAGGLKDTAGSLKEKIKLPFGKSE